MDAEKQKADSGADHAEKTQTFHAAESKVSVKGGEALKARTLIELIFFRYKSSNKSSGQASWSHVHTSKRSKYVKTN